MVEIHTLFQTKTAKKTLYKGLPPGAKNELQIMSLATYARETK